jgi:hypothetical protein
VTDDFDLREFADRQPTADEDATVNIRGIRLAASDQEIATPQLRHNFLRVTDQAVLPGTDPGPFEFFGRSGLFHEHF